VHVLILRVGGVKIVIAPPPLSGNEVAVNATTEM